MRLFGIQPCAFFSTSAVWCVRLLSAPVPPGGVRGELGTHAVAPAAPHPHPGADLRRPGAPVPERVTPHLPAQRAVCWTPPPDPLGGLFLPDWHPWPAMQKRWECFVPPGSALISFQGGLNPHLGWGGWHGFSTKEQFPGGGGRCMRGNPPTSLFKPKPQTRTSHNNLGVPKCLLFDCLFVVVCYGLLAVAHGQAVFAPQRH